MYTIDMKENIMSCLLQQHSCWQHKLEK